MKLEHWREYLIEAWGLGTFMVSAGVFATILYAPASPIAQVITNDWIRGILMGIAMGATATGIMYSPWGKRSGAHINPAVTITFFRLKKITPKDAFFYIVAQFIGGLIGVLLVKLFLGEPFINKPVEYVVTVPGKSGVGGAFLAECIMAFIMMSMVLITSNINSLSKYTGFFAGFLVTNYVIFGAPFSGFGMNPARTFASALPANIWTGFWIYYFVPPLIMLFAAEIYMVFYAKKPKTICCKLVPNGEQPCISPKCCGECDHLIRHWREDIQN